MTTVAPASCRLSRGRLALGAAGRTPAGQPPRRRRYGWHAPKKAVRGAQSSGHGTSYTYTDVNGNNQITTVNYAEYTRQTNFSCNDQPAAQLYLVSSVSLPDGTSFGFTYEQTPGYPPNGAYGPNTTGRIASMTLPTGGSITYSYSGGTNGLNCQGGGGADGPFVVPTLTRTVRDNNGHTNTWTYVNSNNSSSCGSCPPFTVTAQDPSGNYTVYTFQDYVPAGGGALEYQIEKQVYQGSINSQNLVDTEITCYNGNFTSCTSTSNYYTAITQTDVYKYPGSSPSPSLVETKFDSYRNIIEVKKYDFGAAMPPTGNPVSDTVISYGQSWNGTTCTAYPSGTYIYNTPCYSHTMNSSGTDVAKTQITYSNTGHPTSTAKWTSGSLWLTSTATYNANGTAAIATDVNGNITNYYYNGTDGCNGLLPTSVTSGGLTTSTQWNCNGGVATQTTDANQQPTNYAYNDPFWRVTSMTDPLGNETYYTYQPNAQYQSPPMVESTLSFNNGNSIVDNRIYMDGLGRPLDYQTLQAPGSSTLDTVSFTYDANGRLSSTSMPCTGSWVATCPSSPATTQTYDALNRPLTVTDGGGGQVSYQYINNDVLQMISGGQTFQKQLEYDGLGRLTSVCEITSAAGSGSCGQSNSATGFLTKYANDALGHLLTVTQNAQPGAIGGTQTRTYVYDMLGRLTSETNPESGTTTYIYDGTGCWNTPMKGLLIYKADANGNGTCFTYDTLNRVVAIGYGGPNWDGKDKFFVYDSTTVNGVAMTNTAGRLAEAYTGSGPSCTSVAQCLSNQTKATDEGFNYTARGGVANLYESTPHSGGYIQTNAQYYANGAVQAVSGAYWNVVYGVDGEGRPFSSLFDSGSGDNLTTSTTYNAAGQPHVNTLSTGDTDTYSYDPNTGGMTGYVFNIGGVTDSGSLNWNANGTLRSLAIVDGLYPAGSQTCNYFYDDLARLGGKDANGYTVDCGSAWAQTFSDDAFGNLSKSGSISWLPGYTASTNRYALGGTSYDANGNLLTDTFHTYTWNQDNHLLSVADAGITAGIYDALGRRVEWLAGSSYVQALLTPVGNFGTAIGTNSYGLRLPLPGGLTETGDSQGNNQFWHSDWLGSTRLVSNKSRQVVGDHAYAPFGEPYLNGPYGTLGTNFTGDNQDLVAGTFDTPNRELNPTQGRWISPDPARLAAVDPTNPQSWNRYAYVLNNPLSKTDPLGLWRVGNGCPDMNIYGMGGGGACDASGTNGLPPIYTVNGSEVPSWVGQSVLSSGTGAQCLNNDCTGYGTQWKLSSTGQDYMLNVDSRSSLDPDDGICGPDMCTAAIVKQAGWADVGPVGVWDSLTLDRSHGDYLQLSGALGSVVGWNGTLSRDLYGRWYLSLIGATAGKSLTIGSLSLTANWVVDPSPDSLNSFLTKWSASAGFGFIFGHCCPN